MTTLQIMKNAKAATKSLMLCDETKKNEILEAMATSLLAHKQDILNANQIDLEKAVVSDVMKDRLKLNDQRINDMAQGILDVVKLPDPTGKVWNERTLENGLVIQKVSVPLGVIAIIMKVDPMSQVMRLLYVLKVEIHVF